MIDLREVRRDGGDRAGRVDAEQASKRHDGENSMKQSVSSTAALVPLLMSPART
jgi:hypothetical protein